MADEDWEDVVGWEVNAQWFTHGKDHNQDGFICDVAGSDACLALGHTDDGLLGWDFDSGINKDGHAWGWDGYLACPATSTGSACTTCESEECEVQDRIREANDVWARFLAAGRK